MSNSALVTYTKISPNKTSPRNHTIDCITIHCMAGNLTVETCGNVFAKASRKASSNYGIGTDGRIAMYVEEKDRSWCSSNSANDHRAITIEVANDGGAETGWHVSDKAMDSLIKLCTDICKRNNIKELKWSTNKSDRVNHKNGCNMTVHRDFAAKSCPGEYLYGKHGYIADEVNKLLGINTSISHDTQVPSTSTYTKTQFIKDVQYAIGAKVDGIAGKETLSKTVTVSKTKNNRHAVVKPIQKYLNTLGFSCGVEDGIAGTKFDAAVKAYQKANGCVADGELTKEGKTWRCILGIL